jgi:hypothetical protein
VQAARLGQRVPGGEQRQHRRQSLAQALRLGHGEITVAQLVALARRLRRLVAGQLLLETLQQPVVDPHHRGGAAEKPLHHLLHRQVVAVFVLQAEHGGEGLLVVETQALLAAVGQQVQAETQARQGPPLTLQAGAFVLTQQAQRHQGAQAGHAVQAHAHPGDGLQVAQAARAFLDVGLEVVRGIVETGVAGALFGAFGVEILRRRPQHRGRQRDGQAGRRGLVAGQHPAFHQRREHGDVLARRVHALRDRTHRLAGRQARVPEPREEAADGGLVRLLRPGLAQHQQVDVGLRIELGAAVTAGRQQVQGRVGGQALAPGRDHDGVAGLVAQRHQAVDGLAGLEAPAQLGAARGQAGLGGLAPGGVVGGGGQGRGQREFGRSRDGAHRPAPVTARCRRRAGGSGSRRRRR